MAYEVLLFYRFVLFFLFVPYIRRGLKEVMEFALRLLLHLFSVLGYLASGRFLASLPLPRPRACRVPTTRASVP